LKQMEEVLKADTRPARDLDLPTIRDDVAADQASQSCGA